MRSPSKLSYILLLLLSLLLLLYSIILLYFFCIVGGTRSGKCLQFEICVKAEFCTENFGGQDTSFTLKGLIECVIVFLG